MQKYFGLLILLLAVLCINQTCFAANKKIKASDLNLNTVSSQRIYYEEVQKNSDGSKDVFVKNKNGKIIKQQTYNDKGILIKSIDFNQNAEND